MQLKVLYYKEYTKHPDFQSALFKTVSGGEDHC